MGDPRWLPLCGGAAAVRGRGDRRTNKPTERQTDGQHNRVKPPLCGRNLINIRYYRSVCRRVSKTASAVRPVGKERSDVPAVDVP